VTEHSSGITWLAAGVGCTPEELVADPRRLVDALADAGRVVTGLALHLQSDHPAVRADAEREAERLRRMFVNVPSLASASAPRSSVPCGMPRPGCTRRVER
jgi:hypothetical protein